MTIPTKWIQLFNRLQSNIQYLVGIFNNINSALSGKENTSNKVTSLSDQSTDSQYPSAKCVYDLVGNIESALNTINSGVRT